MKRFFYPAVLLSAAALVFATETKTWSQSDYPDFDKGSLKNLSLASDGRLMLAPSFHELFDSASVYLWALAEDSKGNLYAGGGGPGGPGARVYQVARNGGGKTLAQLDDLEVHALAVDRQDRVYAATSPDGKVYRIRNGKGEVFFDPKAKYIWDMAFDHQGNLYVATGDRGEIYRVAPDGKGAIFYKTAETHARALAVDANDNLIVGTEPGGLIIRVSPNGNGFVLYQAAKREITAVAVAKDGSIYAAGVGNKVPGIGPSPGPPPSLPPAPQPSPTPVTPVVQVAPHPTPSPIPLLGGPAATGIAGGSEVYRIDKDGYPHRVWTHTQNVVYTIAFDPDGRPLVGTGNKGTIYRLDSNVVYTDLLNAPPTQVTAILAGRGGKLYAATGNVGKVYQIGPGLEKEGTLESDVLDAGLFAQWGRLSFRGRANGGAIEFQTRSGNLDRPQKDWSPWSAAMTSAEGGRVASPAARFLQWKLTLHGSSAGATPEVSQVDVAYLPRNAAPEVQQIEITPPNYKFPATSILQNTNPPNLTLPPLSRRPAPHAAAPAIAVASTPSMQYAKGWIGARWAAADENGDTLAYTVLIRGEKETEWKLLREKLNEKYVSWDSTAFPDGEYRLRVVASDSPSNPAGQALRSELESDPFLIDNTPPQISGLAATPAGNKLTVTWKAADSASVIDKAEYSLNGGDWVMVDPTTRLSDSKEEEYSLTLDKPAGAEQTIAVRVSDEYDNQAVAKVVIK